MEQRRGEGSFVNKTACEIGLFWMLKCKSKLRLEKCDRGEKAQSPIALNVGCVYEVKGLRQKADQSQEPWPIENLDFTQQAVGLPESGS